MKAKLLILALSLLAIFPGASLSEEKSVIVGFKRRPGPVEASLIHKAKGKIERGHHLIPAMTVRLSEAGIENLKNSGEVAYVEANAVYSLAAAPSARKEVNNSWGVAHIFADVAHAHGNKGAGVKVAILDTGIDYTHPDLAGNYIGGRNFVFDNNDPFDDNYLSHGTHVAGIIAAREHRACVMVGIAPETKKLAAKILIGAGFGAADWILPGMEWAAANGAGIVDVRNHRAGMIGVAPEAKILAVKVLDGGGFGREDWIIAGMEWAVANGADIINMSFQGPESQALKDACDTARRAGVLLVAAGGNSFTGGQPVEYPAAYDSVIAVTATDASDKPGYFAPIDDKLELAAPGVDIYSTVAHGKYARLSGTSQAAPHVAGAAALYWRVNTRDLNNDGRVDGEDVRLLLRATAKDLGVAGKDPVFGYGLVNAGRAIPGRGKAHVGGNDKGKAKGKAHHP